MFTKITYGFVVLVAFITSTTAASAAPPSEKSYKISASHVIEINAAYERYLKTKRTKKSPQIKVLFSEKNGSGNKVYSNRLRVTATAYTSHIGQTDSTPNIAAWGDRLHPGMKAIAVSRDLLKVYGLKHGQKVRIKGLSGEYAVLDKMNKRWRKKIDIYMGMNKRKAFKWGRRKVEILWNS